MKAASQTGFPPVLKFGLNPIRQGNTEVSPTTLPPDDARQAILAWLQKWTNTHADQLVFIGCSLTTFVRHRRDATMTLECFNEVVALEEAGAPVTREPDVPVAPR